MSRISHRVGKLRPEECDHSRRHLAKQESSNGQWRVGQWCPDCARFQPPQFLRLKDVPGWESLPLAYSLLGTKDRECDACGEVTSVQEHHWAPRHLFGDECESWPKGWLCQPCHTRWHQVVTPNMSHGGRQC